tara:strand:+ start:630 stop:854 length:225 start_codon:yes stop_codon:yes gene_type:complete
MSRTRNTKPTIYPAHEAWAKENGYREKASSPKPEDLHAANANRFVNQALKASSSKLQAPSSKPQASSLPLKDSQ